MHLNIVMYNNHIQCIIRIYNVGHTKGDNPKNHLIFHGKLGFDCMVMTKIFQATYLKVLQ